MSSTRADAGRSSQQRQQERMQERLNAHANQFPVRVTFPSEVLSNDAKVSLRTNPDLIQHRLMEAGVLFKDVQNLGEVTEALTDFIAEMDSTGCFRSVQVKIDEDAQETSAEEMRANGTRSSQPNTGSQSNTLQVVLNEKRWFSGYVGGGIKHDAMHTGSDSLVPKVQFEASGKLLNLSGYLDTTSLRYAIDQTSATTLSLIHERPLYSVFPEFSPIHDFILTRPHGSKISLGCRAVLDHLDYEWTRSYKECQRLLAIKVANVSNVAVPELAKGGYMGLEWSLLFRDVMPRRHPNLPFALDSSPEIASQSGPSLKHSLSYEFRSNGTDDRFNPTSGVDYKGKVEVAGPPGDVGFFKIEGGASLHAPLSKYISLHGALQTGILRPLTFGGLCDRRSISDRFFTGGPMELRGFVPAGIGPRAKTGGASTPGGDSLGGDFFYTATLAASVPFPAISFLRNNGVRLFGFTNVGTLAGLDSTMKMPLATVLRSTRASVGGGMSVGTSFGRLEATYAVPMRYSPRDARRSVQVGIGFAFG